MIRLYSDFCNVLLTLKSIIFINTLVLFIQRFLWLLQNRKTFMKFCLIPSYVGISDNVVVDCRAKLVNLSCQDNISYIPAALQENLILLTSVHSSHSSGLQGIFAESWKTDCNEVKLHIKTVEGGLSFVFGLCHHQKDTRLSISHYMSRALFPSWEFCRLCTQYSIHYLFIECPTLHWP